MITNKERGDGRFTNIAEYDALLVSLRDTNLWTEVPVLTPYSDVGHIERWFRNQKTKEIWRLVEPDPPFRGLWERVAKRECAPS